MEDEEVGAVDAQAEPRPSKPFCTESRALGAPAGAAGRPSAGATRGAGQRPHTEGFRSLSGPFQGPDEEQLGDLEAHGPLQGPQAPLPATAEEQQVLRDGDGHQSQAKEVGHPAAASERPAAVEPYGAQKAWEQIAKAMAIGHSPIAFQAVPSVEHGQEPQGPGQEGMARDLGTNRFKSLQPLPSGAAAERRPAGKGSQRYPETLTDTKDL